MSFRISHAPSWLRRFISFAFQAQEDVLYFTLDRCRIIYRQQPALLIFSRFDGYFRFEDAAGA